MHARMCPSILRGTVSQTSNTRTLRSNTKKLLQIPHTNLKRFGDRAFCAYAPRFWNELPGDIKAADIVQNFKKQLKTAISKGVYLTTWTINNRPLTFFKALLNIIGGKGAISNINYYHYYCYYLYYICGHSALVGHKVAQLVRCRTSNQRLAGSIPDRDTFVCL